MKPKLSALYNLRTWGVALAILTVASLPLFAGGGKEVDTDIQLSRPPAYISPGNPATGHDSLTIDNIKLTIDPKGAIKSYILNIYNKNGEVIFTRSEAKLEGRGFFGDLLNIGEVPQVKIPATFNWPGVDKDNKVVADGEYFYQLTVLDSFAKKTSTAPLSVVVDTKPPTIIALTNNYRIFSPNGDGIRDTITFGHKTDAAYTWTETILDETGNVVWTKQTTAPGDTAASDIVFSNDTVWDGKASLTAGAATAGAIVPEGNYVYRFAGADRAGNTASKDLPFVVSFSASDISLGIENGNPNFNTSDGIKFKTEVNDTKGLLNWKLEITDSEKIVFRRLFGNGTPPATVIFDGKGNPGRPEGDGNPMKDGDYFAQLITSYDSGALSSSDLLAIKLDSTPPLAKVVLDSAPDATEPSKALVVGYGSKDQLKLALRYETGLIWTARFEKLDSESHQPLTGDNASVFQMPLDMLIPSTVPVSTEAPSTIETLVTVLWKGDLPPSADAKQPTSLPDGLWEFTISATDKAGNQGMSAPVRFIMDRTGTSQTTTTVSTTPAGTFHGNISVDPAIFSPDGDGQNDTVKMILDVNGASTAVTAWKVEILDPAQHAFRTWSGTGAPPANIVWDGKSDQGELVQSAMDYTALFTVQDGQNNTHRSMATITTDILVIKEGNRLRINLPNIVFPGNSADIFENARTILDLNLDTLRRLARILNRYADYHISIEGHATHVRNNSAAEIEQEQTQELVPLSARRALEVKQALNILAVKWERMETVGLGGSQPLVPHTDLENRWKNRRVEFILDRK